MNFKENFFSDFPKKLKEKMELREANISLNEKVESPLKAIDMFLNNLKLEQNTFLDRSVRPTIYIPYDVGVSVRFELQNHIFRVYTTFNTRQRGELQIGLQKSLSSTELVEKFTLENQATPNINMREY